MDTKEKKPELPKDKIYCPRCLMRLSILEDGHNNRRLWCANCEAPFLRPEGNDWLVNPK